MRPEGELMLLHFTKGLSNVESILQSNSLRLSYCSEYFGEKEQVVSSAAHPMVYFSEYSGDELESKVITYGSYAIAFKKKWARRKKGVMYIVMFKAYAIVWPCLDL